MIMLVESKINHDSIEGYQEIILRRKIREKGIVSRADNVTFDLCRRNIQVVRSGADKLTTLISWVARITIGS